MLQSQNVTAFHWSCLIFFHLFSARNTIAQSLANRETHQIHIRPATGAIVIDGLLNEETWHHAAQVENFWQQQPVDGQPSTRRTVVALAYDDRHIHIAAICYDDPDYVIETLKRDGWDQSDQFAVLLDPIGQQALAYGFGVNAHGSQSEALISAPDEADFSWDNRWMSAVTRQPDHWIVEMAVPYKSMRFKAGQTKWGVQFIRYDPGTNENTVWAPVPRQFSESDLGYFGSIIWDSPPGKVGGNIAFIPYGTVTLQDPVPSNQNDGISFEAGADAKIALTSSLNLDLTTNPDFSQVEVDQQVTNLTRFGIFFPERRQFFIENNDVFTGLGTALGAEQPFYSRRIGLDEQGRAVPILYGIRLTGNINSQLRIGAFNIHAENASTRLGQNYTAATVQQRLGRRSFVKGLFLNRQSYHGTDVVTGDFGRNLGGEVERISQNGIWQFKMGGITSLKDGYDDKNLHLYGRASYAGQRLRSFLEIQGMGENYFSDMGFTGRLEQYDPDSDQIVRVGFTQISNMTDYYIYPDNSARVNFHWSGLENFVWLNPDGTLNEWYTRLRHFIFFKSTSVLRFRLNNNYVDLLYPFNLTDVPLPATSYNMTELNVQYNSDNRKLIKYNLFLVYGQFFNGTKWTTTAGVTWRRQPWGNFSIGLEQHNIYLPAPYGNLDLTLANARIEINFSNQVFWTTFLQYNTQANNFNLNSRLQWRFAPMSDVYLVYTDNYRVEPAFGPKDRTLVLKMNYWLSL